MKELKSKDGIIFNPPLTHELIGEGLITLVVLGTLIYGSFVPYNSDSLYTAMFFCGFFLVWALLFIIPINLTNHIWLNGKKIYFRHASTIWKLNSIDITEISEINIWQSKRGQIMAFSLYNGSQVEKNIKSWETDLMAYFLYLIKKEKQSIVIPEKYSDLVKVYDDKDLYEKIKKEYNRRELFKVLFSLGIAISFAVAATYMSYSATGKYNIKTFGDTFFNLLGRMIN